MGAALDTEFPMIPITGPNSNKVDKYGDVLVSFSDTVFGFWEDVQAAPPDNSSNSDDPLDDDNDEVEEDEKRRLCSVEKNKAFWEQQYHLLQATLRRSTSRIERRVRQATKEALTELNISKMQCFCQQPVLIKSCRNCLRREICNRLLNFGYDCGICKSKWRSSSDIRLSGEHTYLEVTDNSNTKREVKVVIELNFRAEFEMARANEEYNRLMTRLPEVFVGKTERLQVLIKIMCLAAKKCMKEKKMHLGPWRKHKYMQAKWLGMTDRSKTAPLPKVCSARPHKPKASMLTSDLLGNIPSLHCAVRC